MQQSQGIATVELWQGSTPGVQVVSLQQIVVGFVVAGSKRIYHNDTIYTAQQGDVFVLCQGVHHIEDCPPKSVQKFEQVVFNLTAEQLQRSIVMLVNNYNLECLDTHKCPNCRSRNFVVAKPSALLQEFFLSIYSSFSSTELHSGQNLRHLRTPELIYHILTDSNNCLRSKLLSGADVEKVKFRCCIYDNILKDNTIESLAQQTHRSLTSFKKEFTKAFATSPHKWFIEQRLQLAKTLLYTSDKTVSEIGNHCTFTNTSHFIRLFKQRFNITPYALKRQIQRGTEGGKESQLSQ